jgi:YHS domain-containing protein
LTFGERLLRIVRRIFMAKDPVCGMNVEETKAAATSSYKGQTYYFCAKVCKESFDKDPEKYLDKNR